jgi:hypothetical protein
MARRVHTIGESLERERGRMQSPRSNYSSGEECGLEGGDGEIQGGWVLRGNWDHWREGRLSSWEAPSS